MTTDLAGSVARCQTSSTMTRMNTDKAPDCSASLRGVFTVPPQVRLIAKLFAYASALAGSNSRPMIEYFLYAPSGTF